MPLLSLLDEEAAVAAVLAEGDLDEPKARLHVKTVVHQLFVYERNVIHKKLLQDFKDGVLPSNDPIRASRVANEFKVGVITQNLPRSLYKTFEGWTTLTSTIVQISESTDYVTTKLLIQLQSGHQIESVILRHNK